MELSMNTKGTPYLIRPELVAEFVVRVPEGTYNSHDGTYQISVSKVGVSCWKLRDTSTDLNELKSWEFELGTKTLILGFALDRIIRLTRIQTQDTPIGATSTESNIVLEQSQTNGLPNLNSPKDRQIGGNHYKDMPIQPSEFIAKNSLPWYEANAIKYLCRHSKKNGKVDLEKAKHYVELALEHYYGKE